MHHPNCPMSRGGKTCIGCGSKGPSLPNPLAPRPKNTPTPKTPKRGR